MSLQNLIDRSTTFVRISLNRMMFYYGDPNSMMIRSYKDVVKVRPHDDFKRPRRDFGFDPSNREPPELTSTVAPGGAAEDVAQA
jgi:hypothetical protein